jgi:hypothetical protein
MIMEAINHLIAIGILLGSVVLAPWSRAQAPSAPAPVKKIFTKQAAFKLPLQTTAADRQRLSEIQLYVKTGADGVWLLKDTAPPSLAEFTYRAPADGEYWFMVVTVDKAGKRNPPSLDRAPPGLVVVVDRQPPDCDVQPFTDNAGTAYLQCHVRDAHPDLSKTKIEYQTADQTWKALAPAADQPGMFCLPPGMMMPETVRATVVDLAGNTKSREIQFKPTAAAAAPELLPCSAQSAEHRAEKMSAAPDVKSAPHTDRAFVNRTHVTLNYAIDDVGPAGVGEVEVWMTKDDGKTWQRLCTDPAHHNPVHIELPGDGVYGLSVVVSSGDGHKAPPPATGDAPDCRVEVDTTKPLGQLLDVHPGTGSDSGIVLITWTASDKNLKPEPIDLSYAARANGPWQPLAHGLKNQGSYRWTAPSELDSIYVRIEISDLAGNVTSCVSPQAVVLARPHPKAHVVSIAAHGE